jgi:hypothetical protein
MPPAHFFVAARIRFPRRVLAHLQRARDQRRTRNNTLNLIIELGRDNTTASVLFCPRLSHDERG